MEYCEQPSLAMTHLSMKIGRFICDSAVEVSNAKIFNGSNGGFRCNGGYDEEEDDDDEEEGDDVIPGMRTHSSSDLRGLCRRSRRFDVSDVRIPRFESDEPEPEVDDRNGSDVIPWLDYDYDRTLRPFKNDRILNLLSRVVRSMNFASGDDGSPPEADKGQGGGGGGGRVAEPEDDNGETVPLPWRSTEAMSAVEDSSKYLREKEEEAAAEAKDEDDNYEEDPPSQSLSSLSGSSSFRNIPSSDGYDAVPRPDHLSAAAAAACHYSGGLSLRLQWLSEAESRHSDLFCPAHHRPTSPPEPSSIRSSVVTGHRLHPQPRRRYRPRDRHSQSNSHSGSSAEMSFPTVVDEEEEEEEGAGSPNQRDKVLQWLLASDLEVTAQLDEADDDRLSDVVCSGGPSIASGWSRPRIVRDDNGDE